MLDAITDTRKQVMLNQHQQHFPNEDTTQNQTITDKFTFDKITETRTTSIAYVRY